jgi:prepilin-type N-terminal cleavage/methylation domain-containing protein
MIKNKGFTLIELLVVISIISLLSSVVMASVTGARNKAKEKAFRSELMQFVNALEMYKNDKGSYPNTVPSSGGYYYGSYNDDISSSENTASGLPFLYGEMSNYMKSFPKARGNNHQGAWFYMFNDPSSANYARCTGDTNKSGYVLVLYSTYWGSEFSDWPTYEYFLPGVGALPSSGTHCFSIK